MWPKSVLLKNVTKMGDFAHCASQKEGQGNTKSIDDKKVPRTELTKLLGTHRRGDTSL